MKRVSSFLFCFVPVLIAIGIQLIATFFLAGVSGIFLLTNGSLNEWMNLMMETSLSTYTLLIYSIITLVFFGVWYYHSYEGDYHFIPGKTLTPLSTVGLILMVPGLQILCNYLVSAISFVFPSWLENYEDLMETAGLSDTLTISMFFYAVLLGPIAEELIFRGVTLKEARRYLPFWAANLLQAFLFGCFHMNLLQGSYAFALGLVLGYICHRSGNIYNSILVHILFNFFGTVLSQFLDIADSTLSSILLLLAGIVFTLGGLLLFNHFTFLKSKKRTTNPWQNLDPDTI